MQLPWSQSVASRHAALDLPTPAEPLLHTRDLAQIVDGMIAQQSWGTAADIRALPAVEAAVRLFATHIAGLPMSTSRGPLPEWLRRPRKFGSQFEQVDMIQLLVDAMVFHGAGYLLATCVAEGDAPSFRLDAVDPDYVQTHRRTDGIIGLDFLMAGEAVPQVPWNLAECRRGRGYLVHIPYRVSVDRPEGTSPLIECAYMLRGHVTVERYAAELFDNGTHIGGVLTTDGDITTTQAQEWQKQWMEARKARRVAVLGNGLHYDNELADPNELQLVEARSFNQAVVWSLLGIPLSIMGASLMGGQSSLSYSNAQDDRNRYVSNALRAFTDTLAESLSRLLPPGRNESENQRITFDYSQWEPKEVAGGDQEQPGPTGPGL